MTITVVTPASGEPVTLALAKASARITHSHEDDLLTLWLSAARERVENMLDRPVRQAGYRLTLASPDAAIAVPGLGPFTVTSARSVTGGVPTTIASTEYTAGWDYAQMVIEHATAWPAADTIEIDFTVGYAEVPAAIKSAILMVFGELERNREAGVQAPDAYEQNPALRNLLQPYRLLGL